MTAHLVRSTALSQEEGAPGRGAPDGGAPVEANKRPAPVAGPIPNLPPLSLPVSLAACTPAQRARVALDPSRPPQCLIF